MRLIAKVAVLLILAAALLAAAIPAGKTVRVRLNQAISSETARNGDSWDGVLMSDIVVNGKVVAAKSAAVRGKVVEARKSGRLAHPGLLRLRLTSIGGQPVSSSIVARRGQSHKGRNVKAIGGTAAAGAVIGALAGGGKGAAIGAGAGAAAGTAGAAATGKKDVRLPAESVVTFTTR